jgi:preprotein translocase subunit YajC
VTGVLWLVALAAIGYFLLIRPTRRRAQEVRALQSALGVGADVILTSGIFGTVTAIADERVSVEIADGVVVRVHRGAIGKIMTPDRDALDSDETIDAADADTSTDSPPDTGHEPRGAN